jgi:TonB family protein
MADNDSLSMNSDASAGAERRQHGRSSLHSLSYVQLDETNGGILLNVSEGGLAVHAAMSVMENTLTQIRLQPPHSRTRLETAARVAWTGESRRMLGIEFQDPSEDFRRQLREWIAAEVSAAAGASLLAIEMPSEADLKNDAPPVAAPALPRNLRALATAAALPPQQRKPEFDSPALANAHESADKDVRAVPTVSANAGPQDAKEAKLMMATAPAAIAAEPFATTAAGQKADSDSKRRYIPALIVLAALSLFAGWEAGRGNWLTTLFQSSSTASASSPEAGARPAASLVAGNFLVIDANNQSWLVPFAGPTDVAKVPPSPVLPPQTAAARAAAEAISGGTGQAQTTYQVATLYAPQSSSRANSIQSPAPALAIPSSPTSEALPAALADSTPRFTIAAPAPLTASSLIQAAVTRRVEPTYPTGAIEQRIQGSVVIQAHIAADGTVSNVHAVSGPSLLTPAAIAAVRKWRYHAEILDGHPVASEVELTVQFKLPQ